MSDIGAITQVAQQAATQPAQPTSLEAQLFSYMAQLQAQGVVTGERAMLANPSNFSGDLFRYVRGFVERQTDAHKIVQAGPEDKGIEAKVTREGELRFAALDADMPLHRGPAREPLERAVSLTPPDQDSSSAKSAQVERADADQLMEEIVRVFMFHTEAGILHTGTQRAVEDVNTLIRSQ
jgi:hypothetical protein